MRRLASTLVLALAVGAAACGGTTPAPADAPASAPAPAATDVLVLNNFTLIDGRGGPAVADSALIATDGRITWIGPKSELKAPAGASVQDLSGKFVMPGLVDLHTHVSNSDVQMQDPVRFFTREGVTRDLKLYASYGTTTVASLGTDQKPLVYEMREEQRKGRPRMPAVALTAYARAEDRQRIMLAGFQVHVAKPVEPTELVATVGSFRNLVSGAGGR